MLNEVMDAVTRRLDELFDGKYAIYTDEEEQGVEMPCFFVQWLEPQEIQMIGKRAFRRQDLVIHFFQEEVISEDWPENDTELSVLRRSRARQRNEAADILLEGMEYVMMGDGKPLHGTGRRCQIVDGVLQFFVSYNFFVYKEKETEEIMEGFIVNPVIEE